LQQECGSRSRKSQSTAHADYLQCSAAMMMELASLGGIMMLVQRAFRCGKSNPAA